MTTTSDTSPIRSSNAAPTMPEDRLPLAALLALTMAAFITILTEALPAGLLPQMSESLSVSEALVGQLVTIYAIGSPSASAARHRRLRHREYGDGHI